MAGCRRRASYPSRTPFQSQTNARCEGPYRWPADGADSRDSDRRYGSRSTKSTGARSKSSAPSHTSALVHEGRGRVEDQSSMDVRCEKCMTVYEFDDSKVGEQGVTVKCTQCGNLFKVKRRERTQELAMGAAAARSPAYVQPAQSVPSTQRTTVPGIAVMNKSQPPAAAK